MPCYDKKLEAVRDDFTFEVELPNETSENGVQRISEVDLVLTSGEVLDLIKVDQSLFFVIISLEDAFISFYFFCFYVFHSNFQLKSVDFKSLEESPLDNV